MNTERNTKTADAESDVAVLARLDRIPVWPYSTLLLWILGAGYFFAFFDIVNIGAALPEIARQFHISTAYASWAVTASLIAYIIGAYVDGTISDIWGRRLSLALSVLFFTVGSVGAAFSPGINWLIGWRFIAGMGIGAEIASVTTYLGEISPAALRGRYTSWATTFAYAGFAAVPFMARALVPTVPWGWRALFLIGALGGVTVLFMRRGLRETPRWLLVHGRPQEADAVVAEAETVARRRMAADLPEPQSVSQSAVSRQRELPARALLRPPYRGRVLLLIAVWFFYYIGNYGWLEMAPTLLQQLGYSIAESLTYLIVTGIGFFVGALGSVYFNDRFERKYSVLVIGLIWSASLFVIGFVARPGVIMGAGFVASTTIGLLVPILYTLTAEHFTTRARATGVALTDGLGHIGGAVAPPIVLVAADFAGFSGGLSVMALTGLIVVALLPFTVAATRSSLESVSG